MTTAVLPDNEAERLAELRALALLDTPPEERFDRITRIAAQVLQAPIAYIALVDADRQWFKAKCGLKEAQTPREISFCGHTILNDAPLIVPDATRDERFRDNPLVTGELNLRFYAGHPLKGPGGFNVGTLCVADHQPRAAEDFPVDTLKELASLAEHELQLVDLISTQRQLLETKTELLRAQEQLADDLKNAAAYVESLLPEPREIGGAHFETRLIPSEALGGDFVGVIPLRDGRSAFYLLDVTGHGVAASLMAVSLGNVIRQQLLNGAEAASDPAAVLTTVNQTFEMSVDAGRFATIWYGVFDPQTRALRYSSAGHHPALVIHDGETAQLNEVDVPIGVMTDAQYRVAEARLDAGDQLYLFSDGLFEQRKPGGGLLGRPAVHEIIERHAREQGGDIDEIIAEVRLAAGDEPFDDDVSIMKLRIE